MAKKRRGDIDAIRQALRPRMGALGIAAPPASSTTVPPHSHSADKIGFTPAGLLAGDDVQEVAEELDSEKLARDGTQTMLGALDMDHHSISNIDDAEVEGTATVAEDVAMTGGVGLAKVTNPRVISMTGDEADAEGRVNGVNGVVYNAVTPTPALGRTAFDATEDTFGVFVASGASVVFVAIGWATTVCVNGYNPA